MSRGAPSTGLIPYGDYVVGWTEGALHAESDFYDLVEHVRRSEHNLTGPSKLNRLVASQHIDKPLRLYVYSSDLE